MKKCILFLCFSMVGFLSYGQRPLGFGAELHANGGLDDGDNRSLLLGLNVYVLYNRSEIYAGFDVSSLTNDSKRAWGFEVGTKFHIMEAQRKSHFLVDLNHQRSTYFKGFTTVKTRFVCAGFGYELFCLSSFSLSLSAGPGFNWVRTINGHMTELDPAYIYWFKAGVRIRF